MSKDDFLVGFGLKLRTIRREANYTQKQLADLFDVTANTIGRWETGEGSPPAHIIREYTLLTGRSYSWMFSDKNVIPVAPLIAGERPILDGEQLSDEELRFVRLLRIHSSETKMQAASVFLDAQLEA